MRPHVLSSLDRHSPRPQQQHPNSIGALAVALAALLELPSLSSPAGCQRRCWRAGAVRGFAVGLCGLHS
eukprot:13240260-Alexandrium_andersonii.AAC.1